MDLIITPSRLGDKPPVTKAYPEFLQQIGEERFRKVVSDHYELLKNSSIKHLFPVDDPKEFEAAKKHAADFMIQICGGPAYFNASRGAPQMGRRHAPFRITAEARVVWLELYAKVLGPLADEGVSEENIQSFWRYLEVFSKHMVNTPSTNTFRF
ncbi:MAG: globin [Campylobacterota bacterium]